jgi:hypothetical protein
MTFREVIEYYKSKGIDRIQPGTEEYDAVLKMCGMEPKPVVRETTVRYAQPGERRQPLNAPVPAPIATRAQSKLEWLQNVSNREKFNAHIRKMKSQS